MSILPDDYYRHISRPALSTAVDKPRKATTFVTLASLCDRYRLDPVRARMKLRRAGMRPPRGTTCWEWAKKDSDLNRVVCELLRR